MWLLVSWVAGLSVAGLVWIYVGYLVFVVAASRLSQKKHIVNASFRPRVSLMIMTYNEEVVIEAKLQNTLQLDYPSDLLEVLVVDSASTDSTVNQSRRWESRGVRVICQPERAGKASAIDFGLLHATGDIAIVTDANAMIEPDALLHIVRHFADPGVGGVAGAMQQRDRSGTSESASGDLYWRIEKIMRTAESKLHSVIGMSGEISAYRRSIFVQHGQPVSWYTPGGPDDLDQTIYMIRHGYRVVYEPQAIVWEPAPDNEHDIADQKIRVITMTIATVRRRLFSLANSGWYGWCIFPSRKVLPLLSPLLIALALIGSTWLLWINFWWSLISAPITMVLILSCVGAVWRQSRSRVVVRVAHFFMALNWYVVRAWLQYMRGRHYTIWEKVDSTRSALMRS